MTPATQSDPGTRAVPADTQPSADPWLIIQAHFVDDPKRALEEASALVEAELEDCRVRLAALRASATSEAPGVETTEQLRLVFQHLRNAAAAFRRTGL